MPSLVLSSLLLRCLPVTPSEVDALRELYSKLSNELHQDNIIHKDEFMWALFKANKDNLFAERVFELFDIKQNNVIDFGEFTRSLSVFHPKAPLPEKAKCESMCGRGMACSSQYTQESLPLFVRPCTAAAVQLLAHGCLLMAAALSAQDLLPSITAACCSRLPHL